MRTLGIAGLAAGAVMCANAETWSAKSPDGMNEIRLSDGAQLTVEVLRGGKSRVAPTAIALEVEGKGILGVNAKKKDVKTASYNERIATPVYKKAAVEKKGNQTKVSFEGGYAVSVYASDDGVAYRFETEFGGRAKVLNETFDLAFPGKDQKLCAGVTGGFASSWESIYDQTALSGIPEDKLVYLPLLAEYDDGGTLVLTESDLLDYPGLNLRRKGGKLQGALAKFPVLSKVTDNQRQRHVHEREAWLAETDGTRTYPWRVFILADKPIKMVESDIVYSLAAPNRLGDVSWVKPGKVAWDWWNNWNVSHVNFRAGCNTETYKYYIDFAKRTGVEYVIFDEGWSVKLKIMEISPDVDVPGLIKYANDRGVGIILWCAWSQLVGRQEEVISKYAEMGAKGFKIDFMDRDDQDVVNFLSKTAEVAAKYKLLVDYHGMFKPTGMHRTYPNIINYEGVHGLEQCKWEEGDAFPRNDAQIVFTRMVAGPMDYTPGAMINHTRKGYTPNWSQPGSQGTRVHQMALMSLYEAPLQMLCDSPTQYIREQECFDFMAAVPTVWDETIGLDGAVGKYAAIARRKGDAWYVSAICDWNGKEFSFATDWLERGAKYKLEIFADGINADRDATDYVHTTAVISGGDAIKAKLMPGGGWTARIVKQ